MRRFSSRHVVTGESFNGITTGDFFLRFKAQIKGLKVGNVHTIGRKTIWPSKRRDASCDERRRRRQMCGTSRSSLLVEAIGYSEQRSTVE